ncbi:MAG: MBL fold metallo-hydrolase [Planctomycetota bacterium]
MNRPTVSHSQARGSQINAARDVDSMRPAFTCNIRRFRISMLAGIVICLASKTLSAEAPWLVVLGTAQDGGYPQAGCQRDCCKRVWDDPRLRRFVSCVAIVDPDSGQRWLLDCTPDFRDQLHLLDQTILNKGGKPVPRGKPLDGIFPTHAHVGHYAGLIHLGREVLGADRVPVYCMPRMRAFLETNGPWEQLVRLGQIDLRRLQAGGMVRLNERLTLTVIPVPHRDEYSETVAFRVQGPNRSVLYLPDIDKWNRWGVSINTVVADVDTALLDATFFDVSELPGRDMNEIPHPFMTETMERFKDAESSERRKIHFIHMNHTNPALVPESPASRAILSAGFHISQQGQTFDL